MCVRVCHILFSCCTSYKIRLGGVYRAPQYKNGRDARSVSRGNAERSISAVSCTAETIKYFTSDIVIGTI